VTALLLVLSLAQPPADSAPRARADTAAPRAALRAAPAADPWWGEDKMRHFVLAGLVQGGAFGVATAAGMERRPALAVASGVTALVSLGKEWYDRRRGRAFSGRDLAWDAAGAVLWGALVARSGR
jgi:putative lipoprotein